MTVRPAVDVVKIAVDLLTADADVTAAGCKSVSSRLPATPAYPCITVQQIDAAFRDSQISWTDEVHLDIDVWGDPRAATGEADVSLLTRTARVVLLDANNYMHAEGVVVDVDEISGPHWLPSNDDPPKPRYVFSIVMKAHPNH